MAEWAPILAETLAVDAERRRAATSALLDAEGTPGFTLRLLSLAGDTASDEKTRLLAATYFKNTVRKHWNEEVAAMIPTEDRTTIKAHLVDLMASVPPLIQRQCAQALAIISNKDFPDEWPTLLPDLVARLGTPEIAVVIGVLETANSIFERFRDAPNTDAVRSVLRLCLDAFAEPLLATITALTHRVESSSGTVEDRAVLTPYLQALRLCVSTFHSLAWLELPDVFDEHLGEWMSIFQKFIVYSNPALEVTDSTNEEGPLEALQAAILDVIALFADKFDEDFEPFFPTFAGDVWTLLAGATTDRIMACSMDILVTKAVKFLTASVSKAMHVDFFKGPGILEALCEKVIVPNITLREDDVINFEENPMEFIHQDIEGSDSDTRRRVASDLVRGLMRHFEEKATAVLLSYVNSLLAQYEGDRATHYLAKDGAIALLVAIVVKAQTAMSGVTLINDKVDLGEYLNSHILAELPLASVNERPVVKAACIKFVATFRSQFTAEQLEVLLPMLIPFTGAESYVVHTYAASAIERLLMVRDRVDGPGGKGSLVPRLSVELVSAHLVPLFTALFSLMSKPDYPENDYLMRTLMRVVAFVQSGVTPYAGQVIEGLTTILTRVCANPANPTFNHYLFETVAALMKNVCAARPESVADFEAMLFPPFQSVLSNDVMEFLPYVFQILAQLLELRPAPAPGTSNLTPGYESLFPPLLTATLWLRVGNVPALTQLMQAYLRRGAAFIASSNNMGPLLGVWQQLLATPNQEEHAFALMEALFEGAPWDLLSSYFQPMLNMSLEKLHGTKSARLARLFSHASAIFLGFHGAENFAAGLENISPGLFYQVVENVLITQGPKVLGREARKETAIGYTRLLTETPSFLTDPTRYEMFSNILTAVVELLEPAAKGLAEPSSGSFVEDDTFALMDETMASEYSASYSRLIFSSDCNRNAFVGAGDPKVYLGGALGACAAKYPGVIPSILRTSPVARTVAGYAAAAGVAIV